MEKEVSLSQIIYSSLWLPPTLQIQPCPTKKISDQINDMIKNGKKKLIGECHSVGLAYSEDESRCYDKLVERTAQEEICGELARNARDEVDEERRKVKKRSSREAYYVFYAGDTVQ